jgi:hypothetical protein
MTSGIVWLMLLLITLVGCCSMKNDLVVSLAWPLYHVSTFCEGGSISSSMGEEKLGLLQITAAITSNFNNYKRVTN